MPRPRASCVASSLVAAVGLGGVVMADEPVPTTFERAITAWMSVVTLLADDAADRPGHDGPQPDQGSTRDRGSHERRGAHAGTRHGATDRLQEIVERLARIERKLDDAPRMGNPWSPRPEANAGRGAGPRPRMPGETHSEIEHRREERWTRMAEPATHRREGVADQRPRRPAAPTTAEMQQRMRDMMQEGRRRMADAKDKMEQARRTFEEMEERIRKLEAEVERLKSAPR